MKIMLKQFENHPDFSGILCTVQEEYRQQGAFFLEEPYLRELHARLELFPRSIDAICRDAAAIRREPEKASRALPPCSCRPACAACSRPRCHPPSGCYSSGIR